MNENLNSNTRNLPIQKSDPMRGVSASLAASLPHAPLPRTALIRRAEVERLTALSRSRLYVLMATGDFPRPVSLGAKSVAWCEVEVYDWIAARIADRALAA